MNDDRFIELLKLYVDDQLGPEEASELEAEVLADPSRRRTYNQYCRLQRGCSLLGDSARSLAPSSQGFARSLRAAERKIAAPRRPATWRTAYAGAFSAVALAACAAVVLVLNRPPSASEPAGGTLANVAPVSSHEMSTSTFIAAPVASTEPVFDFQPVLVVGGPGGVARNAREAEIAASDREALEWMQRIELLPGRQVVVDEHAFETRPTLQPDNRVFRGRHSIQGNTEFAAFQFQR